MVRTGLGSDTPTMLMEILRVWLNTSAVADRCDPSPALQGSSLPFAEELIHRRPDRDSRACGVLTLLPGTSCGFDTWFCRCKNDARAVGLSLTLPSNSHVKHSIGSIRQNLRASCACVVVSSLALPPSCRPWSRPAPGLSSGLTRDYC